MSKQDSQPHYLLAGDIGATKTLLGIYHLNGRAKDPLSLASFASKDYADFEAVAAEFLAGLDGKVAAACLGIAGPVSAEQVKVTNLPWTIAAATLQAKFGFEQVWLLNDLQALANAVPILGKDDLHTLHRGKTNRGAPIAVIAPGTGLGEAFLTWDGAAYQAHASEGGHTDFGPRSALEVELLSYLLARHARVPYEFVCSGTGIPNIYAFLKDKGYAPEPEWLAKKLAAGPDPAAVITETALQAPPESALCQLTLETFISILGAEAGNLALKVMATGGIYLGGGIVPHLLPALEKSAFIQALQDKTPYDELLAQISVHVILNPKAGLLGAAYYGFQRIDESP
ncbi:MAG: glucokinase [Anaerolineae bacterium]|nr:glucokinase [Anaerolineae bacterium]